MSNTQNKIVVGTTHHKKPIYQDQHYFLILNDLSFTDFIGGDSEPKEVLTRFLTITGVNKFIAKETKKREEELAKIPEKTEEELLEEKILSLKPAEQLDYVNSEEDFDKWLKRNKYTVSFTNTSVSLKNNISNIIYSYWSIGNVSGCCGGKEQYSHSGSLNSEFFRYSNTERDKKLLKYLAPTMLKALRLNNNSKNMGLISYVKQPGQFSDPSARIGMMLEHLDCFTNVGKFKNPNTGNILDIYVVNSKWATNIE